MLRIVVLLLFLFSTLTSSATTYYLSNAGSDANAGTSPAQAWRTPARVGTARLRPGDRVLLAGGQVFGGSLVLGAGSQGTASQPIVVSSYGAGRATVESGRAVGFYAHNAAGIELRRLAFVGAGRLSSQSAGVVCYLDSADAHLSYLRFDSLEVSGYRGAGLSIGSWNGLSGYDDVRITGCELHANGEAGLTSYAAYPSAGLAHHRWYVGGCTAYDNAGRADLTTTHSGNGIVLSGIDGVLIEHCTAYHNGWLNANPTGGPVGIWGWNCHQLTIQFCESHHNLSGTTKDGGGFDLDGGCTNSVMQYNYSHDNQGPGYLLAQFEGAPPMHDLTVRYNISENDARGYDNGALTLWAAPGGTGIARAAFYNNSVYLGPLASGARPSSRPKALYVMSDNLSEITLRNNLLQTSPGLPVLTTLTASGLRLEGNCYWTAGAALLLDWNGTTYASLSDWRAATGQEQLAGGARLTGLVADPQLATSAAAPTPESFNLGPASKLAGAGLNLATEFSLDPGLRDFFGNATPRPGAPANIGASEARPKNALASLPTAAAAAWCQVYPTVATTEVRIVSELATSQLVEVSLFDNLGRLCQHWSQPGSQLRAGGLALPLRGLAAGHYLLHVQSAGHLLRQSLLIGAE